MKLVSLFVIFSLLTPHLALACEPCAQRMDWMQTAKAADVIVVGRKFDDGPNTGSGGPDFIDLKVDDELVGVAISEVVRVNSWDGMCPYGVQINNGDPHIVFLRTTNLAKTKAHYSAVSQGCSATAFPIIDDYVVMGKTKMPLDQFKAKLQQVVR